MNRTDRAAGLPVSQWPVRPNKKKGETIMSYCRVCGDESEVTYHRASGQFLCPYCAKDTPAKLSRSEFIARYFAGDDDCPESTKREFYEDYQRSTLTFEQYVEQTVSEY